MTTMSVPALLDFNKLFVTKSDASRVSIGAVLMLEGRLTTYTSKTFFSSHLSLSIYEKGDVSYCSYGH